MEQAAVGTSVQSSVQVAVQIKNLTKKIGQKTIVDNLTFDIHRGEVFGFLGPNGAGKTTTIRMMVGLISKTNGDVLIHGVDVSQDFKAAMKHVGVIVENPEMYKYLTGYQNLVHFAKMSGGVTKERIADVVKQVGLDSRIHDKVKTYSLGMRQRLGLAQALLRRPDVLILDEPTNGLDPAGIRELRDYLRNLANTEGLSVIVSSHLLSEMELMCDRVAIIQAGKLVDIRSLREDTSGAAQTQMTAIEIDNEEIAMTVLKRVFPSAELNRIPTGLALSLRREDIPVAIKALTDEGVKIYGVQTASKSLEDTFLEITGGASNV